MPLMLEEMKLKPNERAALEDLKLCLRERFGERLVKLVFYGSRARGEGDEESDLDMMAVIRDSDGKADIDAARSLGYQIGDRHDVYIQLHVYSVAEWEERLQRQWPFHTTVEAEGVALVGSVSGQRSPMTPENRRHYAQVLMDCARESLRTAEGSLSRLACYRVASSEACVAILRAADAMLGAHDTCRPKFRGVVAGSEGEFVKTGLINHGLGSLVRKAWKRRIVCTYDVGHKESREGAERMLADARGFLRAAEERLKVELAKLGEDARGEAGDGEES